MPEERPRPGIRLTDTEREAAAARLHAAHDEGRISLSELDERLAVIFRARVAGDLEPAFHDLAADRDRRPPTEHGDAVARLRVAAAARLQAAYGEGRISLSELDERLAAVYRARVAGDLEPVLHDVPTDRERRLLSDRGTTPVELRIGPRGLVRSGRWTVPRRIVVDQMGPRATEIVYGWITLDFRTAVVRHPRVDVELKTLGPTQLILPSNGSADLSGLRGAGWLRRTEVPTEPVPGGVHLVVRGVVVRRSLVRVAYRPRRWWL